MPKILFTASTYSHIVHFHRPYLARFRRMGWTVHVACGGTPAELPEAHRTIDVPFEKQMLSWKNGAALRQLRKLIGREHYDLISCHTALAACFTRLAVMGQKGNTKVACTCHGYLFGAGESPGKDRVLALAERITAPVTDLLMTMNAWDTQYASVHRLGRRVTEIPGMGLDSRRLPPAAEEERRAMRRAWGVEEEDILLLYGAEFSARKSQHVLLCALKELPPRVKLALPGQGELFERCREQTVELGLEERVLFPGQVSGMGPWYAAADMAVSASRSEGLPFNVMEAMYYGLPVVASRVKGHTDLLEDARAGLLYPYGDWRACADCVAALAEDPARRMELGSRGRQAVEAYCLDRVLPRVMEEYETLLPLETKQPAARP